MPRALRWRRDRRKGLHTGEILQWLVICSCVGFLNFLDAVAGDAETGRYAALRVTSTGQHANAAILAHGQQINDGDDGEEKEGHLKDGRKGEGDHREGSEGREGEGPGQRIGRGGSCSPGRTGRWRVMG